MDLADQALLAVQVGGVELVPGLLANADPVQDGELLPVDGVGVERPTRQGGKLHLVSVRGVQKDIFQLLHCFFFFSYFKLKFQGI